MAASRDQRERLIRELRDRFTDMLRVTRAIRTRAVAEAFRAVPRHLFVDRYYDFGKKRPRLVSIDPRRLTLNQARKIYSDEALVTHRAPHPTSSTSQPQLVAVMLEDLLLGPGMKVLEIGAGTGWNAALMGYLVGSKGRVTSIDIQPDVAGRARRHLHRTGIRNVDIVTGDGWKGHPRGAPYDRVITTVGCPDVSFHWLDQLREGGLALIALQEMPGEGHCYLPRFRREGDHFRSETMSWCGFMGLQGTYGVASAPPGAVQERLERITVGQKPRRMASLWPPWLPTLRRDLMVFASLEGMLVEPVGKEFVVGREGVDGICVVEEAGIGVYEGMAAYHLLEEIARKWIGLGAPRRNEYLTDAWPKHVRVKPPKDGWLVQRRHSQLIFRLNRRVLHRRGQ